METYSLKDLKHARLDREMILYRREVEEMIKNARTVKGYDKWCKVAAVIDAKLK